MPFLTRRLESASARAIGVFGVAAGGAVATVGAAATVAAATTTAIGSVVHEGAMRGGDVVEYATNRAVTCFHQLTVSDQEKRAALLYALRTTSRRGPENVAAQQRLAIAKCFQKRLASQIRWPIEGLDDEFPFDVVICIAQAIKAKPAGPPPPGASTIKIYRPIATATGALTDNAKTATKVSIDAAQMGGVGFLVGGALTLEGSNFMSGFKIIP